MVRPEEIKPNMPVVSSRNSEFGVVDHIQGQDTIKLKRDSSGKHHFIPLSWVTSVDKQVHIDRADEEVTQQWRTEQ